MTDQHGSVAITVEFLASTDLLPGHVGRRSLLHRHDEHGQPSLLTRIIAQGLGILSEGKMETGIRAALDTLFEVCYRRA